MNTKALAGGVLLLLIILGVYAWTTYGIPLHQKVAANSAAGGVQYVYITDIASTKTAVTMGVQHVTYFEGEVAKASATHDVKCSKDIATCVPSIKNGYYVRPSAAKDSFTLAPVAHIKLLKNPQAGLNDLTAYLTGNKTEPIFTITVANNQITEVSEVNHL